MIEGVPYFVGGGAHHSAEVMRQALYIATGGQEGILSSQDLKVDELPTPDSFVNVAPGSYIIRHRGTGGQYQSYTGRAPSQTQLSIPPTDSSGGRNDLLVLRVENPYAAGESETWPVPSDQEQGPYAHLRLISDVPNDTVNFWELGFRYSAIPMCRLEIPASTGTITQDMITDLRCRANLFTGTFPPAEVSKNINKYYTIEVDELVASPAPRYVFNLLKQAVEQFLSNTNFEIFPDAAQWNVSIPNWARNLDVDIDLKNVELEGGDVEGEVRLVIGGVEIARNNFSFSVDDVGRHLNIPLGGGDLGNIQQIAGQYLTAQVETRITNGAGRLAARVGSHIRTLLDWKE